MDDWWHSMVLKMRSRRWDATREMTDSQCRALGARMLEKVASAYGEDSPLYAQTDAFVEACINRAPFDVITLDWAESKSRHPSSPR